MPQCIACPLLPSQSDQLPKRLSCLRQVLLKWNVQRGVPVIPKAGSEPHLRENIEGLFAWRLSWDQKAKLDALDCGQRLVAVPFPHVWDDAEEGGAAKPSRVL